MLSLAADLSLENRERFPTVLQAMTSTNTAQAQAVLSLIEKYNWKTLVIIMDEMSAAPLLVRTRLLELCKVVIEVIKNSRTQYVVIRVDSGKSNNFTKGLVEAASYSKGINLWQTALTLIPIDFAIPIPV